MRTHALLCFASLAFFGAAAASTSTPISVRRCTAPDGTLIFTDKECAALGAIERRGSPARELGARMGVTSPGVSSSYGLGTSSYGSGTRPDCARSPGALVASLSSAAQANDVNRVAGLVDWGGAASGAAHRLLRKLGASIRSAPVEVSLESNEPAPDPYAAAAFTRSDEEARVASDTPRAPTSVRVDRMDPGGAMETMHFGLRRDLGCWWLASSPSIEVRHQAGDYFSEE